MKRGIGAQNEELGVNNHSRHPGSGTSGPLYSAPASDRARGGSKDGYRSTSSNSNANPSRDRDERGGRGRERERDDRAWQEDRERGRELTGSGERKRSLVYTDDRDDRRSGDGRECKHFVLLILHIPILCLFDLGHGAWNLRCSSPHLSIDLALPPSFFPIVT